jgi:triacylglycerol esterase/lipase EstA (alpha/beta hydrolase family)
MHVLEPQRTRVRPTAFKALLAAICLAGSVFIAMPAEAAHDPVIMIPGMGGSAANMATMKSSLQNDGWRADWLFTWTDEPDKMTTDMEASARAIGAKVDEVLRQTGASKVVLATWSASTIAGRYYLKNLGGDRKVSQFISFAGPHHGISIWQQCTTLQKACREQWGPIPNTPWLKALNADTEVPGWPAVRYLTLRGSADTNATPVDTAVLTGADENFLVNGANHFSIINDATALAKMRSFIKGHEVLGPEVTSCSGSPSGAGATVVAQGDEKNGPIVGYRVRLNGPIPVDDAASVAGTAFSKAYALADGAYTGTVTATDNLGRVSPACALAFTVGQAPVKVHDPVIIGTGMSGDLSKMEPIEKTLVAHGWSADRVKRWKDSTGFSGDVPTTARELSAYVDEVLRATGARKVVLIGWSSSTISFRYYLKNLGGASKVSQYIGIAGPQHGTSNYTACQYTSPACAQWGPANGPFLAELNGGTEVPGNAATEVAGDVDYLTIRGTADVNATPYDTAILAGADENAVFSGLTHYTLLTSAAVHQKIRDFITAHEDGTPPPDGSGAPSGLGVTAFTASSVSLSWTGVSGVAGYNVYRASSASGPWTRVNGSPVAGTSYTATGLTAGTAYHFMVRGQKSDGTETGNSNTIGQTTAAGTAYSESVNATVYAHYLAGRVNYSGYITLGQRYGYVAAVTLYRCGSTWTDKASCAPL